MKRTIKGGGFAKDVTKKRKHNSNDEQKRRNQYKK
jgi:hypothetical protein